PKSVNMLDLSGEPHLEAVLGPYPSVTAVPVFHDGVATEWALLFRDEHEPIDPLKLRFAINNANLLSRTVRWQRLVEDTRRLGEELRRQVDRVAALQRQLLPPRLPDVAGWSFASSYQPCMAAGA